MDSGTVDSGYEERVWQAAVRRGAALGERARTHYSAIVADWGARGVPDAVAASLVVDRVTAAQRTAEACLEAFNGLVAAVQVASETLEAGAPSSGLAAPALAAPGGTGPGGPVAGDPTAVRVMTHMLETRRTLARLYHFLAELAPEADLAGVATQEETRAHVAEAEEALARWRGASGPLDGA